MPNYKEIHYSLSSLTCYLLVSESFKQNKPENRDAWGLRPVHFNGVTSLKKKDRLYLLQKVFKKAFFTRRKLGLPASILFPTNRPK